MTLRSALFVDFDNVYSALERELPEAAARFATKPDRWLRFFQQDLESLVTTAQIDASPSEARPLRRILVRRCYLNPRPYHRFRPYLIRSAFEVIDCPQLTQQGKTSADIVMAMDVMDLLQHETHFDEFILLSGDADFTPVLLRLRAHDRRTAVLTVGPASSAYKAAADVVIDSDLFLQQGLTIHLNGTDVDSPELDSTKARKPAALDETAHPSEARVATPDNPPAEAAQREGSYDLKALAKFVRREVKTSDDPIHLGTLAQRMIVEYGTELRAERWQGAGSFKAFLENLQLHPIRISARIPGLIYNPDRHRPEETPGPEDTPEADEEREDPWDAVSPPELCGVARKVHDLTEVPLLLPTTYQAVFETITELVNAQGFQMSQTGKAVRDRCNEVGATVARADVNFVLRSLGFAGHMLGKGEAAERPEHLARVFLLNVLTLCERARLDLDAEEISLVQAWIGGELLSTAG